METQQRDKKRHLREELLKHSKEFDFFEAVRRIDQATPENPRTGQGTRCSDERIRFAQDPSLSFAPTSITDFQVNTRSDAARMLVSFFGLLGPNGPMQLQFTEYVRMRSRNNLDPTIQRFLDIFHHRLISLFYRAWSLNEQAVSYDRRDEDSFSRYVGSLIGLDMDEKAKETSVPYYAKLYWSGRFFSTSRNADGLHAILQDFFDIPVKIEEFIGTNIPIPRQYYCKMGRDVENATIGQNAVVGAFSYTTTEKFKIIFGPLDLENFERMLPGQDSFKRLHDWVNNYLSKPLLWEVQYILKADEVPKTKLGHYGQLGATTWLKSKPFKNDSLEPVIQSTTRITEFIKK